MARGPALVGAVAEFRIRPLRGLSELTGRCSRRGPAAAAVLALLALVPQAGARSTDRTGGDGCPSAHMTASGRSVLSDALVARRDVLGERLLAARGARATPRQQAAPTPLVRAGARPDAANALRCLLPALRVSAQPLREESLRAPRRRRERDRHPPLRRPEPDRPRRRRSRGLWLLRRAPRPAASGAWLAACPPDGDTPTRAGCATRRSPSQGGSPASARSSASCASRSTRGTPGARRCRPLRRLPREPRAARDRRPRRSSTDAARYRVRGVG